jgi:hypothetical protein
VAYAGAGEVAEGEATDETEWLPYTDPKQGKEDRCEKGNWLKEKLSSLETIGRA